MLFAEYEKQAEGETYTYASYCRRYNEWKQANGIFRMGVSRFLCLARVYG